MNINTEDGINVGDTPQAISTYQKLAKEQLRTSLNSLPTPKNDYEIVVPEHEEESKEVTQDNMIEDQADLDARQQAEIKARSMFSKKSI